MAKLEGIIYKTFDHYVVLRGFAPLKDLARISHKPDSYQRTAEKKHIIDIINFLNNGEYKYFPEVTLACRVIEYNEFASNIGIDNVVDRDDARFVPGLKVLSERLPYDGYRARHAYLVKTTNEDLVRVDGNHRLEPFDEGKEEVWAEIDVDKNIIEKLIVPYTVIFSEKEFGYKFEAGIFHNINFQQLPLREEASLRIISDKDVFQDKEALGEEYPLTLALIQQVEYYHFNAIHWLKTETNVDNSFYRTSCLRIAQLLVNQKKVIQDKLSSCNKDEDNKALAKNNCEDSLRQTENKYIQKKEQVKDFEKEYRDFLKMTLYKSVCQEADELYEIVKHERRQLEILTKQLEQVTNQKKIYERFVGGCDNPQMIIEAIRLLIPIYDRLKDNYGNIAFLCAMVYYAILNQSQLDSFVDWAERNGINKITDSGEFSKNAALELILMFEEIYQTKKNRVFVSMQFGDSQSELIYEKIGRAIDIFNSKYDDNRLLITPIRIDRTIEASSYQIQDAIKSAIQNCGLLIADLSSANINVYHEIGYAMGIAESKNMTPNIILLYKENTDFNKDNKDVDKFVGFNLRNLSQLRFKDYDQLVDGLVERLEKYYGLK